MSNMTSHPRRNQIKDWPAHLKQFRMRHGLTQKKLADLLAVSARVVQGWEFGDRSPPPYLKRALTQLDSDLSK